MITKKKLVEIVNLEPKGVQLMKNADYAMVALTLLRERIPYEVCKSIIGGITGDEISLCNVDNVIPYISEEDAIVLRDCNVFFDECFDRLVMYV